VWRILACNAALGYHIRMSAPRIAVILPAAGRGTRFGSSDKPKVEMDLAGKPAFLWCVELFSRRGDVGDVLIAVHPDRLDAFRFAYEDMLGLSGVQIVAGGTAERWETVANALDHVDESHTHVAVHDAARPLATPGLIDRVFAAAEKWDAVLPGVPVASTLKRVADLDADEMPRDAIDDILGGPATAAPAGRRVVETVDRRDLVEVQTPQVFSRELLRRAYAGLRDGSTDPAGVTDDAALVEAMGQTVAVVEGESTNLKITRPADAELAAALLERRAAASARDHAERRLFLDEEDE
jgi:2-C-methyl-D-erythritol 4-phosphate cytidylyltransferase